VERLTRERQARGACPAARPVVTDPIPYRRWSVARFAARLGDVRELLRPHRLSLVYHHVEDTPDVRCLQRRVDPPMSSILGVRLIR
jgi:hypothetical protein